MAQAVTIVLPGTPVAKGRPQFSGRFAYTPKKTRDYEARLRREAGRAMLGRAPLSGPLIIAITVQFLIPKSWPNWKRAAAAMGKIRPTGTPDWDNSAKVIDALNEIVFHDDSQIVEATVKQIYAADPLLWISVETLDALPSQVSDRGLLGKVA